MSLQESIFSKIMIGVSVILLATALIGVFGMYRAQAVQKNEVEHCKQLIKDTRTLHNKDIDRVGSTFNEFRSNQTIMMEDIKDILKNMPK